MHIQPYLSFDGRCDEAIEFYKSALGATVQMLMRFREMPGPAPSKPFPPKVLDKVMHGTLKLGDSDVNVTDGHCLGKMAFSGISLSLTVKDEAEADRVFHALADGGKITMPIGKTFFSPRFGMVDDRFGVSWLIIVH